MYIYVYYIIYIIYIYTIQISSSIKQIPIHIPYLHLDLSVDVFAFETSTQ